MARETHRGKLASLRVHRVIGFGRPIDHIRVHAVITVDGAPDGKAMGFPLNDDGDRMVHEAWIDLLREAYTHGHTVLVESDFDTEAGNNGIIRMITLTKE